MISRDGLVCLGDFGLVAAFGDHSCLMFNGKLETVHYVAPEQLYWGANSASQESVVYSLAMTSFTVCPPRC